jgi:hypothetical protein
MKEFGFLYDSSMVAPRSDPPLWPFTLDYRIPHKCHGSRQRCPSRSFNGMWEMIMNPFDIEVLFLNCLLNLKSILMLLIIRDTSVQWLTAVQHIYQKMKFTLCLWTTLIDTIRQIELHLVFIFIRFGLKRSKISEFCFDLLMI